MYRGYDFANISRCYVVIDESFRDDNGEFSQNRKLHAVSQLRAEHVERSRVTLIARLPVLMAVATQLSKVPLNVV